jgi:DNA-directed RNA polymerase specialized sigma24 family protein
MPTRPEDAYRTATDTAARRRIQAEVVDAHRDAVARIVRTLVASPLYREDAEQAGLIGVLVALEKYQPGLMGEDRGGAFRHFMFTYVRHEIQQWLNTGVYWRKSPNRGTSDSRKAAREAAKGRQRYYDSLDAGDFEQTLHDTVASPDASVEEIVAEAEAKSRLRDFAETLSNKDAKKLLSDNSQCVRSQHYLSLVGRAAAFVKGDDDGYGDSR